MREEFVYTVLAPIGRDESLIPIPHVAVTAWEVHPDGSVGNQATAFEHRQNDTPAQIMETNEDGVIVLWFEPGDYQIDFSDTNLRPRINDFTVGFTSSPWANRGTGGGGGGGGGVTVAVVSPGNQSTPTGTPVTLQIVASASDGTTPTFIASGLPSGLTISSSGLISGTTAIDETETVTVTARAPSTGDTGSTTFTWTVGTGGIGGTGPGTGGTGGVGNDLFGGDGVFGGGGLYGV